MSKQRDKNMINLIEKFTGKHVSHLSDQELENLKTRCIQILVDRGVPFGSVPGLDLFWIRKAANEGSCI